MVAGVVILDDDGDVIASGFVVAVAFDDDVVDVVVAIVFSIFVIFIPLVDDDVIDLGFVIGKDDVIAFDEAAAAAVVVVVVIDDDNTVVVVISVKNIFL